ncbi:MAG: ECF transporter S component [Clostridia bacterium]|nr:ECF transporter S component [Clostridia bacterium]
MKKEKTNKEEKATKKDKKKLTRKQLIFLIITALFIAIIMLMDFSPLGYIYAAGLTITLMPIPVVAGAISLGPVGGMILGFVFGLTSFLQCFGIGYVIDPSAGTLFQASQFGTIITCFVPRILMGLCVSLLFKALMRFNATKKVAYPVAAVSGAVFNTAFFLTSYIVMFKNTVLAEKSVMSIIIPVLTLNTLIEICVTLVIGGSIAIAVDRVVKKALKTTK